MLNSITNNVPAILFSLAFIRAAKIDAKTPLRSCILDNTLKPRNKNNWNEKNVTEKKNALRYCCMCDE